MALVHRASGFSGALVRIEGGGVEIRGRTGLERVFRLTPGAFAVDGRAVTLVRPGGRRLVGDRVGHRLGLGGRGRRAGPGGPGRTAVGGGRPRRRAGRAGVG